MQNRFICLYDFRADRADFLLKRETRQFFEPVAGERFEMRVGETQNLAVGSRGGTIEFFRFLITFTNDEFHVSQTRSFAARVSDQNDFVIRVIGLSDVIFDCLFG